MAQTQEQVFIFRLNGRVHEYSQAKILQPVIGSPDMHISLQHMNSAERALFCIYVVLTDCSLHSADSPSLPLHAQLWQHRVTGLYQS
jgi:hypothetical protein